MAVKARATVERCSIYVQGTTFTCPLCRKVVQSGEHHECARWPPPEYRADGWPLCPRCRKDALRSVRVNEQLKGQKLIDARQACEEEFLERRGAHKRPLTIEELAALKRALVAAGRRRPRATDEMKCAACGWSGGVSARHEQASGPTRRGQ